MRLSVAAAACLASLALSGCAGRAIQRADSGRSGAVIGNVKIPGGYAYLNFAQVGHVGLMKKAYVDPEGNFILENLSPGKYYLVNASTGQKIFNFTASKEDLKWSAADVQSGEIVFLGSFVVRNVKKRLVRQSTFEVQKVAEPDEKAVIRALIPHAKGTGWDGRLQARLKKL